MPPDAPPPPAPDYDGWATLKRFLPYLWPEDRKDLRIRIAGALLLVLLAKAVTLLAPIAMKHIVDTMAARGNPQLWVALSFVIAFVAARFLGTAFDNLRNIVFERVGQEATQQLAEDIDGQAWNPEPPGVGPGGLRRVGKGARDRHLSSDSQFALN